MRRNQRKKLKKINKLAIIIPVISVIIIVIAIVMIMTMKNQANLSKTDVNKNKEASNQVEEKEEIRYSKTNGGNFVKIGNMIGYLNSLDEGALHMINLEDQSGLKVNLPTKLSKLYFDGEFFYGMPHHYQGKGIYKIDLAGNVSKIYEGECIQLWIEQDQIYFVKQEGFDEINQIPQGDLCKMSRDGSEIQTVISNIKSYFKINQDTIYYTNGETRALFQANLKGEEQKELAQGRISITGVTNNYIVYLDFADQETYHVLYLSDGTNHEVGRFGSSYITAKEGYIYTRKLIGQNNEIENDFSVFQIDDQNKQEKELWKSDQLQILSYVFQNKAYFERQGTYQVKLSSIDSIEENTNMGLAYLIDGKAYEMKRDDMQITQIIITNLETGGKQEIKPSYQIKQEEVRQGEDHQEEQRTEEVKTPEEVYGWTNEPTEGKTETSKEEAIEIWKSELGNLGKNNNIIAYQNYTFLVNATKVNAKPNSLFQQTTNATAEQANFSRKVWKLETSENQDALQMLDVYVDCYTGKIIGGAIYGD